MGFDVRDARIVNLRDAYPKNRAGLVLRAHETKNLIGQILQGDRDAPNLIDGAVLTARIGGAHAFFEADALAARFDGPIHAGEVKSFPVVDGRPEPDKLGAALDQVPSTSCSLRSWWPISAATRSEPSRWWRCSSRRGTSA